LVNPGIPEEASEVGVLLTLEFPEVAAF